MIENRANGQSAILLHDEVLYGHDDSIPVSRNQQQVRPSPSGVKKDAAYWAIAWGGVPGVIAFHWLSTMSNVKMNLLKKELRSQTVEPGKTGGGFVFAPTGGEGKVAKEVFLDVPVKDGASNEVIHFYFRIDMRSEGK